MKKRAPSYQFTITDMRDNQLYELKKHIKSVNKFMKSVNNKTKLRVSIMPRFGADNPKRPKNWQHGWCRVEDATRFDVYLREVY